ncbi:hypothetical protein [Collimonas humicola]|uniref:hypothetical protein n=1 Tax=Collimonas humicola TaxID=2825886 RepID=UPI001B8B7A4F|nr:hypothetical protein [Collimonas humicola]
MAAKTKNRDDFRQQIKDALCERVATLCSNPDCRAPTAGPTMDKTKVSYVGQAAHITAAAPGGPRFNIDLSTDERKDFDNGIWLCNICAKKIDLDETHYTVSLLRSWKSQAEATARSEHGVPKATSMERNLFKVGLLKTPIHQFVSSALSNMSEIVAAIDPRFSVEVHTTSSLTQLTFTANEPVVFRTNVLPSYQSEFNAKMRALVEHGESLVINSSAVRMEGSALLEMFRDDESTLSIKATRRKPAAHKISLRDPNSYAVLALDDFVGEIVTGTKSFKFEGRAFNGLYRLRYRFNFSEEMGIQDLPVEFLFNYETWEGRTVTQLPYFDKLLRYFEALQNNWIGSWILEIEGKEVITGSGTGAAALDSDSDTHTMLRYLKNVREILSLLGTDVPFTRAQISGKDISAVISLWSMLCEQPRRNSNEFQLPSSNQLTPANKSQATALSDAVKRGDAMAVEIDRHFDEPFNFCGTYLKINPVKLHYSKVRFGLIDSKKITPKKTVGIAMTPEEDCVFLVSLSETPFVIVAQSPT